MALFATGENEGESRGRNGARGLGGLDECVEVDGAEGVADGDEGVVLGDSKSGDCT